MDRKLLVLALMGSLAGCVVVDDDDDDHDWDSSSTMSCEYTDGAHSDDPLVSCRTGIGDDWDWFANDCEDSGGWAYDDGPCSSSDVVATCTYDLDGYAYVDNYYVWDDALLDSAYADCMDYGGDWWEEPT